MPQNATTGKRAVSSKQERAIELLLAGETVTQIALQLEVDRSTVYRWHDQPQFVASLNRNRLAIRESFHSRMESLQGPAISAVEEALSQGDKRVALDVLKGSGLLNGKEREVGPTIAEAIERQQAEQTNRDSLSDLINSMGTY